MAEAEPGGDPVAPLANIDRLIHEPARLLIMSYLYVVAETCRLT
jgi:hypothetical protein